MNQSNKSQISGTPAEDFGRILHIERERRELSIGEVAKRLKLTAKQIEAFEAGDYESMREAVFIRGFLRTYGRFLDLDEQIVSEYLEKIMPQQGGRGSYSADSVKSSSLNFQNQKISKPFPTWIFGLLVIPLLIAGVYVWQGKSQEENSKQTASSEADISLGQVAAPNVNADNVSVLPMQSASSPLSDTELKGGTGVSAGELLIKVRYRSMLVVKDKNGKELIKQVVPANSEHWFSEGAPYSVSIGYAKGATAVFGSQRISLDEHMVDKKTAIFTVGK